MKKLLFVFTALLLFSCSSSSDDNNNSSNSVYNPPAWIQGTWGIKSDIASISDQAFYKFTSNNVCQINGVITSCWKENIEQFPNTISGSDITTDTTYEVKYITLNGVQTLTLKFQKVSATKILWVNSGISAGTELTKLN